jgi:UDP-N-acetylmuramoyl-L-alanyl-D-glutamate--2,6-diaminopimelate ligase
MPKQTRLQDVEQWLGLPSSQMGEVGVSGVACRVQEVKAGDVFVLIDEYLTYNVWQNGRVHVAEALERGAVALVVEEFLPNVAAPQIRVSNARLALATIARRFYRSPDTELALVGITGTNGKTTTTQLCAHLLRTGGGQTASMGTLGVFLNGEKLEAGEYTTDLITVTCRRLRALVDRGVTAAAMEVSSHALALDRVAELRFRVAVLTNLTRDHLDFHGTAEAYGAAKRRLFEGLGPEGVGVIHADDGAADWFASACPGRVIRYSSRGAPGAEVRAKEVECSPVGSRFRLEAGGRDYRVESRLIGRFQVDNMLAALAVLHGLGYDLKAAAEAMGEFRPVMGRMEKVALPNGATAIIDFAHNPDGLANLLENCRELTTGRIYLVFGCGGDRDRGKRPIMGRIAALGADVCWVTSDNPRMEDPDRIIADVLEGCREAGVTPRVEADRAGAIRSAYRETRAGDLLVVAGKGHEAFQLVRGETIPFSDTGVVGSLK